MIVTIITFLMIHLIPGDPARILAGEKARPDTIEAMRVRLGLDKPLYVQYWIYLKDLATLNLGTSLQYTRPVADIILERLPLTIKLTLFSTLLGFLFAMPLGYQAGIRKDRPADHVIRLSTLVAIAMPSFWVGLLLMILFSLKLKWLPAGGWDPTSFWTQFKCLVLPAFTQSLMTGAILIRNMRNSVVDITRQDYVDFARSKGISARAIRNRHIFRNSMVSTVTLLSMRIGRAAGREA
jgi:peptide/nickel transport system permease protein